MDVLVIGASNIFRRRVLPALIASDYVGKIHVASRQKDLDLFIPTHKRGLFFEGYQEALDRLEPCISYISLPNHLHYEWANESLKSGFHVVIDKPATLDMMTAYDLINIAKEKCLCIAEATVWPFHPQIKLLEVIESSFMKDLNCIQSVFTFPAPDKSNFRLSSDLGGGSFNDLCAYAVSPGRVFYGATPVEMSCKILSRNPTSDIDTAFSFSAIYPGNKILQGYFGFGMGYHNSMTLIGKNYSAILSPAFTAKKDEQLSVSFNANGVNERIIVPPGDSFQLFFEEVIESILNGNWERWAIAMHNDLIVANNATYTKNGFRYAN
jgi:predicted dehydrogenase